MPSPGPVRVAAGVPADAGVRIALGALAWLLGCALQLQQARLWPVAAYAAGLVAALLLGLVRRAAAPGGRARLLLACGALALAGFALTGLRAAHRLADALPPELQGRDLVVTGVVAGLPEPSLEGIRFVFEVEQAALDGVPVRVPARIALGWYRGFDGDALVASPMQVLRAGQRWQLTVRLRQPHGSFNPQGFDLELWLFEQGIRASGNVRAVPGAVVRLIDESAGQLVQRARQHVRDALWLKVADPRAAGVLAALTVGDQAAIERDDWALFRDTGVAHLMSISGLHVTMFAWLAGSVAGRLWRRSSRAMLAVPAPLAARWCGIAAAAGYALLAGWGVPAQRTLLMLAAVALLRSLGQRWPPLLVLLVAAVAVTLLDPWALLQPGFWLSFAAVGLLMASDLGAAPAPDAGAGRVARLRAALRAALRSQAVATAGLAPLSMVFFQQVSLVGFAANLVAIPLVTLVVTPLALAGAGLTLLWQPAAWLVGGLTDLLGWLVRWPWAVWTAPAAPAWAVAVGLAGTALLLTPLPWRLRWLGLPMLLPLLVPPVQRPAEGRFELVVADVGQGTAVLLRTRTHLLVYDAGPRYSPQADAGQRVLLPLLRARGEAQVDLLMLSHRDADHVGGAAALIDSGRVRALATSFDPAHLLRGAALPHRRCEAGQSWSWDGVRFDVLHPLAGAYHAAAKPNTLSCVLRVAADDARSVLLTGDIEAAQEAALLARDAPALRSQVLVVPHHGSRGSSSDPFIAAVAPGTALVQAAYLSRFGHPAPQVVARYRALGVELLRTDACGAWTWSADGATRCERLAAARYWHHRPADDAPR